MKKKEVKKVKKEKEYYYEGVAFLSIQSGSEDQPTHRLLKFVELFCSSMHKEKIRPYVVTQIGKPGGGGCVPGQPNCP